MILANQGWQGRIFGAVVGGCLLLACPAAAKADSNFIIAPYFLFPYMNGHVAVGGNEVSLEADPGDIFDVLDFGAMIYVESRSPVWAGSFDALYMNLGQELRSVAGEVDMKQVGLEGTLYRRVKPWGELLAGARFNALEAGLEINPAVGNPISVSDNKSWVDPFLGVRVELEPADPWLLSFRGDYGGFGIGSESAWQVHPTIEYRTSKAFGIAMGYRALSMDYETGDGADEFRYDVTTSGLELIFRFRLQ